MPRTPHDPHELSIGRIHPVGGEGEIAWVRCPRSEGSVPLERCLLCPKLVGMEQDDQGGESLLCALPASEPPPSSTQAPGPLTLPRLTVGDLMTRNVICVRPHLSLDALAQLFVESQLKAVPVVDEQGQILGTVAEADVQLDVHLRDVSAGRTAGDVMLPARFTLAEHTSVTRAAALMVLEGASRFVVVSQEGVVVGILSATDILYWLAKADGVLVPPPRQRIR